MQYTGINLLSEVRVYLLNLVLDQNVTSSSDLRKIIKAVQQPAKISFHRSRGGNNFRFYTKFNI